MLEDKKKFTLCILGDAQSIHVQRVCRYFLQQNVNVHLITFRPGDLEGIKVHHFPVKTIRPEGGNISILKYLFAIRKRIRSIQPDAVYALYATSYGLMGAFAGVKPFFVHALGSDVLISPQRHVAYRLILRYVFSKATQIFSVSDQISATIQRMHVHPAKVKLAVFGADLAIFNIDKNIDKIPYSIISTRNFEPIYRVDALLPAVALLKDHLPEIRVFLAGKGNEEKKLRELVDQYKLHDHVTFLGHLSPELLAEYLKKSLLYVSLSSSDGTSVSLLEAMACGCIPLITNIPANTAWIQHGYNGFLLQTVESEEIANQILHIFSLDAQTIRTIQEKNIHLVKEKGNLSTTLQNIYRIIVEQHQKL